MGNFMDRQIVYPGAIPLETDLLNTNKFAMTGLAKLASAFLGESTWLCGLVCKPSAPASMTVQVGEGQIYSLQHIDGTPYSSLAADNINTILKQGLSLAPCLFRLDAPAMQGHSINYLIQVAYADTDTGPAVLPYYNAADPAIAFNGPDNSGAPQNTVRSGGCHVSLKAGMAARKGEQISPTPDPGYTAAWVITVDSGALSIDASAIHMAEDAPFLPGDGIIAAVQQGRLNSGKVKSEDDNFHLICQPPVTKLTDGMRLFFRTQATNAGACKLRVGDFPACPVLDDDARELRKGTLSSCQQNEVEWNATLNAWVLCNNQQHIDWGDLDRRYIPVSGGEVKGPLNVEGSLSTDMPLKIGKAEVTTKGDIAGEAWSGGSLHSWLAGRSASFVHKTKGFPFIWKDPVSKLVIQGGLHETSKGEINYPAAFPNYCSLVLITQCGRHKMSKDNSFISDVNQLNFTLHAGNGEPAFYWLAMGY